eukprot:GEMP01029750.1.p1 GENE.GEMP01029750.1~~GEMP01029750.1.p1  ORF type:complete len:528 (+),score=107.05 GEMP01029750.1:181-1764(+)
MAAAFGSWAPLGRYVRFSKTLQLPWSALQDHFADTLLALKDESVECDDAQTRVVPEIISSIGFTCSSCNWEGTDLVDLRKHCASDKHVDRIRQRAQKQSAGNAKYSGEEDSEGSEDEDDESSEDEQICETKATRWRRRIIDRVVFWERPKITDSYGLAICSALLPGRTDEEINQSVRKLLDSEPYWTVICLRSGRFAGAIFDTKTGELVAHKSFHRYTVRAKAGGAQSTQDSTGRKPKSAGSSLRRYGEQRLEEEVLGLFEKWKPYISKGRTFASVSRQLRPLLLKAAGPYSRIPFLVTKVTITQTECLYAQLRVLHLTLPPAVTEVAAKPRSTSTATAKITSTCEERDESPLVYDEAEDPLFSELHRAALDGKHEAILRLLDTENPAAVDGKGRVPYFLCPNATARDVFRKYCANSPDRWDWAAAKVEALTDDMEERKRQKAKEKRRKQKERQKEQKILDKEELAEAEKRKKQEDEERQGLPCANCSKKCGDKPFFRINNAYCSTTCVQAHQRTLAANAALARFNT